MPYKETEKHGPNFLEPPPELIEGEPEWKVEQILRDQTYRCKKQFLIRWKGYAPAHDSWVDESDINAPDLLMDYKKRTVSKVLSQLNQSAAQSSNQSATQSSRPKHQQKICIRTIETDNKETFPHPSPSSACFNLHDPLVATLASIVLTGATTPSTDSSTNNHTSHASTSVPCVLDNLQIASLSDATPANSTSSVSPPPDVSEVRSPTQSMSNLSNHSLTTNDGTSYYSPAVHDEHPLPGPGFTYLSLLIMSQSHPVPMTPTKKTTTPTTTPIHHKGLPLCGLMRGPPSNTGGRIRTGFWSSATSHPTFSGPPTYPVCLRTAMTSTHTTTPTTHTSMEPSKPIEKNWHRTSSSMNWRHMQKMKKMAEQKKKKEEVALSLKRSGFPAPLATVLNKVMMDKSWTKDDDRMRAYGWVKYNPFSKKSTQVNYEEGGV
jgi:hypothetical protein